MRFPWARESPDPKCKHPCFFCFNDSGGKAFQVPSYLSDKYPEIKDPVAICEKCNAEAKNYAEEIVACFKEYIQDIRSIKARNN